MENNIFNIEKISLNILSEPKKVLEYYNNFFLIGQLLLIVVRTNLCIYVHCKKTFKSISFGQINKKSSRINLILKKKYFMMENHLESTKLLDISMTKIYMYKLEAICNCKIKSLIERQLITKEASFKKPNYFFHFAI